MGLTGVACAGLIAAPAVIAGGKKGVVNDKKGDQAKSSPKYTDIVKATGKKKGPKLIHKITVAGPLPDLADIPDNHQIGVGVYSSGTSYFDTYGEVPEGMSIKKKGSKSIKIVLTPKAVGKPSSPLWFAYADAGKIDKAPDGSGRYEKYGK